MGQPRAGCRSSVSRSRIEVIPCENRANRNHCSRNAVQETARHGDEQSVIFFTSPMLPTFAMPVSNTAGNMVGDAAAVHLAASTSGIAPRCELGEFEVITGDPFFGFGGEERCHQRSRRRGLGMSLRGF
jgi:hypothetical protein